MFNRLKQFFVALNRNQRDSAARFAGLIETLAGIVAELRVQTALLEKRDNELAELTAHAAYLRKVEAHKLHRAGQPPIN